MPLRPARPPSNRRSRRAPGFRWLAAGCLVLAGAVLVVGCATAGSASGGGLADQDPDTAVSSGPDGQSEPQPAAPGTGTPREPRPGPEPPLRACTEIGCESQLTFTGAKLGALLGSARRLTVRACLDVRCETVTIEPRECQELAFLQGGERFLCQQGNLTFKPLAPGDTTDLSRGAHTVSLRVTGEDGATLLHETVEGTVFTREQPNGPGCPPVCFLAIVRLRD
jgi:hypothetical protein